MIHLSYSDLSASIGDTPILDKVNFDLKGPGIAAVLGPSGVGKTTLLKLSQRLIEPGRDNWRCQGTIQLNEMDLFAIPRREVTRRVGYISQRPTMLNGSVRANVEFGLRYGANHSKKACRQIATDCLDEVGLASELKNFSQPATSLSGGQAQRLAIARAIALNPQVILMDEPTSALDSVNAKRIEAIIERLGKDKLVILVTHQLELAERLADFTTALERGNAGAKVVTTEHSGQIQPSDEVSPSLLGRAFLFVCGRNTSRSPIAEAVCKAEVCRLSGDQPPPGFQSTSAGLSSRPGESLVAEAGIALEQLGFANPQHRSQQLSEKVIEGSDTIYCMTDKQFQHLAQQFPQASGRLERLDPMNDIEDPSDSAQPTFSRVAKRIFDVVRWRFESQTTFPSLQQS